jgi:hypothetical protein
MPMGPCAGCEFWKADQAQAALANARAQIEAGLAVVPGPDGQPLKPEDAVKAFDAAAAVAVPWGTCHTGPPVWGGQWPATPGNGECGKFSSKS